MTQKRNLVVLLAALALAATGCGDDEKKPANVGGSGGAGGGGGSGGSGGEQPRPHGPTLGTSEHLGTFLMSQPQAVLVAASKSMVLMGTKGVIYDPANFGKPAIVPEERGGIDTTVEAGLLVLDTTTGQARVLGEDDGLPKIVYGNPFESWGEHVTSVIDLDWAITDRTFVGAGWNYLLKGNIADDHTITFQSATVRAPGKETDAVVFHTAVLGETVFAGGDQGLAIAALENLEVTGWVDFGLPERTIHALDAGTLAGEGVVSVLYGKPDSPYAEWIGLAKPDGSFTQIPVPEGFFPSSTLVRENRVLYGFRTPDKGGAIFSWEANDQGIWELTQAIGPVELITDGKEWPILPNRMVYFEGGIVVGGGLSEATLGGPGGGVAHIRYDEVHGFVGRATDLLSKNSPLFDQLPWIVDVLAPTSTGDLYIAGRQLCSEHKTRQLPLLRFEAIDDRDQLVQPWVSGVRSIAVDPVNGETWIGMRDAGVGACEGLSINQSLCRLRADGACVISTPQVNVNADYFAVTPGVVDIAFGDPDRHQVALATYRDALFLQTGSSSRAIPTHFAPHLNLTMTGIDWGESDGTTDRLWVSSIMEYDDFNGPVVSDRGPHGLGYIEMNEMGVPTAMRRYVRNESDSAVETDVPGLPSNMTWDVLALDGSSALVAMGIERLSKNYDHILAEPADNDTHGGVALVDGESVELIAAPEGFTMNEMVALARAEDGTIYALDAHEGIFTVDPAEKKAALWSTATWEATEEKPERGLSLAVDASGNVAVGTTHGLHVFGADTGVTRAIEDMEAGFVWAVTFVEPGVLYAGTDEGLRRIAIGDAALPAKGPELLASWPFPLPIEICGDAGGCACATDANCAPNSDCLCSSAGGTWACSCTVADSCNGAPGGEGCECNPGSADPCAGDLVCETAESGQSLCEKPDEPECGGVAGCSCGLGTPCAEGFTCNFAFGFCEVDRGCEADCSCTGPGTVGGCQEGQACVPMGMGRQECVDDGPVGCEADCSCSGEGTTTDGCYDGQICVETIGGQQCEPAPSCEDDCSCEGPETEGGCPTGTVCMDSIDGTRSCELQGRG